MLETLIQNSKAFFEHHGLPDWMATFTLLGMALFAGLVVDLIARRGLLKWVQASVHNNKINWDDVLWKHGVFKRAAHLLPGLVFYHAAGIVLEATPVTAAAFTKAAAVYLLIMGGLTIMALINALTELADLKDSDNKLPLRSLQQLFKLIMIIALAVTLLSLLLDQNPIYLLSGLGAFTAILLLIFKDTILGLVGGIQLAANDMVRRGDWIEMGKYGADGDVIDVGLTTVKVRNWDKTITTIPTYALITDSFRNWRGMSESGGRRIKRSVFLDVSSIRFMDATLQADMSKVSVLQPYLQSKQAELSQQPSEPLEASPVNGRRLTNVGTFRAYLEDYLKNRTDIHPEMTLLVRQLAPSEKGLPIEIYCFSARQEWAVYESIQADIFDHIYAILPSFGLRAFQSPTGHDFQVFSSHHC
ncbi:mechanosensitive ion channel family protein [Echinimonas agarilytica]|uniref:Mechanosensing system component YbdG n=1 Tax=Echinimonas agarilytica TaxID=1215918 RepID=A0AA41W3T6_9GAMM|nr:mechanosensitive ion channel family protein [Echinimonas agarilytica]MCM2678297.1 mechanosensitive ion channel family protein [Echinimonas agarilytica]